MIASIYSKLFKADKWNIGFVRQTKESFIKNKGLNSRIQWLNEDTVDYAADPFVWEINGSVYVFYEELNFWKGKGELKYIKGFDFKTKKEISGDLPAGIHLSYPYLFEDNGRLYCIPETSDSTEIALYRVNPAEPEMFSKVKVLVSGEPFVDSSIIYYRSKYWLFTSISQKPNKLYIYYSETLEGGFVPHSSNPINVESYASRGAGHLFIVNDILYRPTQNPDNCYGGSVVISKIVELNEHQFVCQTDFEVSPKIPYDQGLHNISFGRDLIVLDGKRRVRSFYMPAKKIIKKIRSRI